MKYSTRSLTVRSDRGHLVTPAATFSTNFVRDAASGLESVSDAEILEATLRILARRVATGSVIANMNDAKKYLAVRFGDL